MSSAVNPDFYLYNLTIQRPSSAVKCCIGNFIGVRKQQQIVRATSTCIELWVFDKDTGSLRKVTDQNTYSNIREIHAFLPVGFHKHLVIITSDSGNLCLLEYNAERSQFDRVVCEPYFKTGVRAITPGEYIAVDGRDRAFMMGAIEKNKFAYTVSHDSDNKPVVSSPLEANRSRVVTFAMCGLDVGFEDPLFAAIESEISEKGAFKKTLTYYELDLGLNNVIKKFSEDVPDSANFLLPVPGGIDGPSGVLVCSKDIIQYKYLSRMTHSVPIPKRVGQVGSAQIVSGVVHVLKHSFFILLQSDKGDIFKVTVNGLPQDSDESDGRAGVVDFIEIKYFDSMPVCSSLLIFRSGFLYANCESGDQYIYQFEKLGDDPKEKSWTSTDYPDDIAVMNAEDTGFEVRKFDNLNLVYILENLNPIVASKLYDSGNISDLPVIYSLCGSGARSSLKVLNHQLPFTEIVTQELPSKVKSIFSTRTHIGDSYDKFIVISFYDQTLVLSVGEEVEEAEGSGLLTENSTLDIGQVGSDSLVQIYPGGLKQIFYDESDHPVKEVKWSSPVGIEVLHSSVTNTQVVLALSSRELVYFETDDQDRLIEYGERKELDSQITSLSLGEVSRGQARFPFILAGGRDQTLTVLNTDPSATLDIVAKEDLSSVPCSLMSFHMKDSGIQVTSIDDDQADDSAIGTLYVHIGMTNGVYARLKLDPVSGELTNPRNQYVGPREVHLSQLHLDHQNVIGLCSVRSYLGYSTATDFQITALSKPVFTGTCSFKSEDVPENGALGVHGDSLTIFTVDQLNSSLLIESIGLRYTPKAMAASTESNQMIYVAESDFQIKSPYIEEGDEDEAVAYSYDEDKQEYYQQFGYEHKADSWGSCLQVVSTENSAVGQTIELANEAAFKVCRVSFESDLENSYLVVSTSIGQSFAPNGNSGSFIRVYLINPDGSLEFSYKTKTEGLALALIPFQGKLLAGFNNLLILYDLGKKQLLKKCTTRLDCRKIVDLATQGFRVIVSDISDSVRYLIYKPLENEFFEFADDSIKRHMTRSMMLDYDTVIVGDKFGELSVLRCSDEVTELSEEDPHAVNLSHSERKFNGAPFKLKSLMNFYIGDIPTSFQKGNLTIGGSECIVYTGLQGTIGCLHPLKTLREIHFFIELQKLVAREVSSLTDRDLFKFRGYYVPVKGCIDGDLLEEYFQMGGEKRLKIAKEMERQPREIDRRISEMRTRFAY
ncbi:DEKNAAC102703 [Brettanomyces naardenensis]|uniref:DEKNAAC102703 n=1 Tax=Brettanomyces naardenensis TaxID=13370 RepID=A0A448YL44_BRENA|nr:DEKNAAC102703 [Brettanomyces naardenensis]